MTNKKRSNKSRCWLRKHSNDKYVQQALENGLRSRAWFKLDEIQKSDKIFKSGITVIDLGSSPGSWSQYAKEQIGKTGLVIACDFLPMSPIAGVDFIQGDFSNKFVLKTLLEHVGNNKIQVIISDMAPNMCGISEVDIPRAMYLAELALGMCRDVLTMDGKFIVKVFQGEGFEEYLKEIRLLFKKVRVRKPNSSRACSREQYIVATGRRL